MNESKIITKAALLTTPVYFPPVSIVMTKESSNHSEDSVDVSKQGAQKPLVRQNIVQRVVSIDPHKIRIPSDTTRDSTVFQSEHYEHLVRSIADAGGNVDPVLVWPIFSYEDSAEYELISGVLRVHACDEAKVKVRALIVEDIHDAKQGFLMRVKGDSKVKLSPWEIGQRAQYGIDHGYFKSARHAARELQRDSKDISLALNLASLPIDLIRAFGTPDQLEFLFGPRLKKALKNNELAVMTEARRICASSEHYSKGEVLKLLSAAGCVSDGSTIIQNPKVDGSSIENGCKEVPIEVEGHRVARMFYDIQGATQIIFESALDESKRLEIVKRVQEVFNSKKGRSQIESPVRGKLYSKRQFDSGEALTDATRRLKALEKYANRSGGGLEIFIARKLWCAPICDQLNS